MFKKARKIYVLQKMRTFDRLSKPLYEPVERQPIEVLGAFTSYRKAFKALWAFIDYDLYQITPDYVARKMNKTDYHLPFEKKYV